MTESLNDLAEKIHTLAVSKGWHPASVGLKQYITETVANIHGEASKLWEAHRKGELNELCDKAPDMIANGIPPLTCLEEELADLVIRPLDMAKRLGVDIERAVQLKHEFNATRTFRNGGKLA